VLSKFEPDESAALESFIARAADAAEMFAADGISRVMNVYNSDVPASDED
jgi:peptidyl-tRNA hydrolase